MSISKEELNKIYERLNKNYPAYEILEKDGMLILNSDLSMVQADESKASFFVSDKLLYESEFENSDELYEKIEYFIFFMEQGERYCSNFFIKTAESMEKHSFVVSLVFSLLEIFAIFGFLIFKLPRCIALIFILPFVKLIFQRIAASGDIHKKWVCPCCEKPLAADRSNFIPKIKYVFRCPYCHTSLADPELLKKFGDEVLNREKSPEMKPNMHKPKKKTLCIILGILLLALSFLLFAFFMILRAGADNFLYIAVNIISIFAIGLCGIALILCKIPGYENKDFEMVVCYHKWFSLTGAFVSIFGAVFMLFSLIPFESPSAAAVYIVLQLEGALMLFCGVWMVLSEKCKSICIHSEFIKCTGLFGKTKEIPLERVVFIKYAGARVVNFLDKSGKKFFSISGNMFNSQSAFDWFSDRNVYIRMAQIMKKRFSNAMYNPKPVFWKTEYSTFMHNHLKAIRLGLYAVMSLFIAGTVSIMPIYFLTDIDLFHVIYIMSFCSVPMIAYCIFFSPVLIFDSYPEFASDEWKSMHIKSHFILVFILAALTALFILSFWNEYIIKVADTGRFAVLVSVVFIFLFALFFVRIPKRLRSNGTLIAVGATLFFLSGMISYGGVPAVSKTVEHYPAQITARTETEAEDFEYEFVLDDGKKEKLNVTVKTHILEQSGVPFVVCQRENSLKIRMVRLHIEK